MTDGPTGDARDAVLPMDEQDLAIIKSLQQDGRRSYGSLAESVGLSETAVRRRTQRLIDAKIMRIVAVPDAAHLRKTVGATIGVFTNGDSSVIPGLDAMPEIDYIVSTLGRYNIIVEAKCSSNEELLELTDRMLALPGITGVECHYYVKYHKQTYSWPPPLFAKG
jgi:Lrp/AsnC family transcriptional regulator, regulator for asnA, asnC and gidA